VDCHRAYGIYVFHEFDVDVFYPLFLNEFSIVWVFYIDVAVLCRCVPASKANLLSSVGFVVFFQTSHLQDIRHLCVIVCVFVFMISN